MGQAASGQNWKGAPASIKTDLEDVLGADVLEHDVPALEQGGRLLPGSLEGFLGIVASLPDSLKEGRMSTLAPRGRGEERKKPYVVFLVLAVNRQKLCREWVSARSFPRGADDLRPPLLS